MKAGSLELESLEAVPIINLYVFHYRRAQCLVIQYEQ